MLSETVQNINIRKTEVSAHVTFVIWILECFANLCIVIIWKFIFGVTGAGTLITSMVLHYLILPYTYLMNTSDNRNLVAVDGWKNVIRNSLGVLNKYSSSDIPTGGSDPCTQPNNRPNKSAIFMTSESRHIIPQG